ncbi:MAG: FecR family protein [Algibacter sp.]
MSNNSSNENLYLKWLNGELSDKELDAIKKDEDFNVVEKIISETASWSLPETKKTYQDLKTEIEKQPQKKGKVVRLFSFMNIAASLLLFIGVAYFIQYRFFDITTYYYYNEEVKNITLPDGSTVILNSNSHLSFNNYNWHENRAVKIEGQVYFDIQKDKGKFDVSFNNGTVQVLGTQFDVFSHQEFTTINCYEGKIKANLKKAQYTLTANTGVKFDGKTIKETTFNNNAPTWISNFTSFDSAPLKEVLISLSLKYGIDYKIDNEEVTSKIFTGKYVNNDLNLALEMILSPLSLNYTIKDSIVHISKK